MLKTLALLSAIVATLFLGQQLGLGEDLVANHPELRLGDVNSIANALFALLMANGVASPTISVAWNALSPINRSTIWEAFVSDWLSFGVGTFAVVLQFTSIPAAEVGQIALCVLAASAPALLMNYALTVRRSGAAQPADTDAREELAPLLREFRASAAAGLTFWTVHLVPMLLISQLLGTEPGATDFLRNSVRSGPFIMLGSIVVPPLLVWTGLSFFQIVSFRRPTAYGQYVWAFAVPNCVLLFSVLAACVLGDMRVDVAVLFAVLAFVGSWLGGIVYVRLNYNFSSSDAEIDSTFA